MTSQAAQAPIGNVVDWSVARADDKAKAAALEAEFDGWHVWRSDSGDWYAVRRGHPYLTNREIAHGAALTVHAGDARGLLSELRGQAEFR